MFFFNLHLFVFMFQQICQNFQYQCWIMCTFILACSVEKSKKLLSGKWLFICSTDIGYGTPQNLMSNFTEFISKAAKKKLKKKFLTSASEAEIHHQGHRVFQCVI